MLLKEFREPLISFELMHFRNYFSYKIKNNSMCKYKILGRVGPLRTNLTFSSPSGLLKFYNFLSFLFILKLSYSKSFHGILNYASTANIQEVTLNIFY